MFARFFAVVAVALCVSGCVDLEPYHEMTKYDLFCDRVDGKTPETLYVTELRDLTGGDCRMQIRHADGHMAAVPGAKWVLPPGTLVARTLNEALPEAAPNAPVRRINGTIMRFEGNLSNRTFVLSGNWRRANSGKIVPFHIAVPLTGTTPAAMTAAASNAVMRLAETIITAEKQSD